jgi:vitamin B12 transporter
MKQQFSSKTLVALLCGAAITLNAAVAIAQNSSTVSVTNSQNPMNPIIVTATRLPTPGNDVLADYTYIGPEEIVQAGQTSLPELLQQQRGVQISSFGGSGNVASVYLRGTGNAQSLVIIDGVKIDSISGGAIWSAIPLGLIDHIEIIYGPQSTFYGSDAMGGVIQIFTKKGSKATEVFASAGYGTYNTSITNAGITGSIGDVNNTSYSMGISQEHSSGFNTVAPNNASNANKYTGGNNYTYPSSATGYTRVSAAGSLSQFWATGQELGIKVFASKNTWQYPGNDYTSPSYYTDYAPESSIPVIDSPVNKLLVLSAYSNNQINDIWQSQLQVSSSNNAVQNNTLNSNDKLEMPSYDFLWQNNISVGKDTLQILGERRLQYANLHNSNYGSLGGCTSNCYISQNRTTDSVAGSYQARRGDVLATIAVRNDNISTYGSKNTGNVALGYFFNKEWRANLNYGTGFRAPSFNDLYYPAYGNATLKPETNRNIEGGLHYETNRNLIHLVAYQNRIENFILPVQCITNCPAGIQNNYYYPSNFSLVQIKGASLGLEKRLIDLTLKGSADAMSTTDETTGRAVPNRANWVGNASIDYRFSKLEIGSNITLTGQSWGNTTNTKLMPGYTLVNLYSSYAMDKEWAIFARWNNIFDTQYQTSYGYLNAGSNIFAGIRYAMK